MNNTFLNIKHKNSNVKTMDLIMNRNSVKKYKFTETQYKELNKEYYRFITYKNFISRIETIISYEKNNFKNNRKNYENKNILDRFIIELINDGFNISANLEDNIGLLHEYVFFNRDLDDINKIKDKAYYKKMFDEYDEKNFYLLNKEIIEINNTIKNIQNEYKTLFTNNQNFIAECKVFITEDDNVIVSYGDFSKSLSLSRYYKLIKNYNKPFPFDLLKMLMRYAIFDGSNQQWSIGVDLYDKLTEYYDISFELFASPLNFNMFRYCSLFKDTDLLFGSMGNVFNINCEKLLNQNIKGVIYNPPYIENIMEKGGNFLLDLLENMEDKGIEFVVVGFLPNWEDDKSIIKMKNSKYVVNYHVVRKGEYILHEKDKGKMIRGTFDILYIVLNSMKMNFSSLDMKYQNKKFYKTINVIRDEIKLINPNNLF